MIILDKNIADIVPINVTVAVDRPTQFTITTLDREVGASIEFEGALLGKLTRSHPTFDVDVVGDYFIEIFKNTINAVVRQNDIIKCLNDSDELVKICMIDDTLGDGTVLVPYVSAYVIRIDANNVTSVSPLGDYTDNSLVTIYVPLGTTAKCCDVGDAQLYSDIRTTCLYDSINDVEFVDAHYITYDETNTISDVPIGTFTDDTLTVPYVPDNSQPCSDEVTLVNGTEVSLTPATASSTTVVFINTSVAGITLSNIQKVSISNIGLIPGTIQGNPLPGGATLTFEAYHDPSTNIWRRLPSVSYDATGTTFLIAETV